MENKELLASIEDVFLINKTIDTLLEQGVDGSDPEKAERQLSMIFRALSAHKQRMVRISAEELSSLYTMADVLRQALDAPKATRKVTAERVSNALYCDPWSGDF